MGSWNAGAVRDDPHVCTAERLVNGGVRAVDETGFVQWGAASTDVQRQHTGTAQTPSADNCQS